MISLSGISKTFNKGNPNEIMILNDFNLEIQEKEFVIIIGSNGSGKTTLLNILAGTVNPDKGKLMFDGLDITSSRDYHRSRWIARIFQNPMAGTASDLTILENFRLASLRTTSKKLTVGTGTRFREKVREKIAVLNLGLEIKIDREMGSLSGGQRQALALLMSIMDETKLLLLDEPAAALDPRTSELIMQLTERVIREYNLTAILVTHQLRDVINYGDRIIQLKEGKIIRDLKKSSKDELNMNKIYEWFE